MSQMDIAGSILAKEVTGGRTVTVGVDAFKFMRPVKVGDVVCCYGSVKKIGNTSLVLDLEVWVKPILRESESETTRFKVTEACFIYVAIDPSGQKRPIKQS